MRISCRNAFNEWSAVEVNEICIEIYKSTYIHTSSINCINLSVYLYIQLLQIYTYVHTCILLLYANASKSNISFIIVAVNRYCSTQTGIYRATSSERETEWLSERLRIRHVALHLPICSILMRLECEIIQFFHFFSVSLKQNI